MKDIKRNFILNKGVKIAWFSRLIAKIIDLFIVLILSAFLYPLGLILALAYLVVSDGLQSGQSVGKKFMGFSVIDLENGQPCSIRQSFIRNLPFIIPLFFMIIPFLGIFFTLILGIPLVCLELYFLFQLDSGRRLGDAMADTAVVSGARGLIGKLKEDRISWP